MSKIKTAIIILLVLIAISYIISSFFSYGGIAAGNVALIKINGEIVSEDGVMFQQQLAVSSDIVAFIKEAESNPEIKAILLEINSPGGTAVASAEIAEAVKNANKTTVAWIREIGTSGAYWVASSSKRIVAHPLSITGSIGVVGSYLEFSNLLRNYNITYERLVSGKYKDIGSPLKEATPEEKIILQDAIDKIHAYFVGQVAVNRNLSVDYVKKIATGQFYIAEDAKNMGLIDELGGIGKAEEVIKREANITDVQIVEYKKKSGFWDVLSQVFSRQSFFVGEGIGSALFKEKISDRVQIST